MIAESRRVKLLEVIRQRSFASLPDLAEVMAVSESTIRRDLEQLESSCVAKRTHGGVLYIGPCSHLQTLDDRSTSDRKRVVEG